MIIQIILFLTIGMVYSQTQTRAPCIWLFKENVNTQYGIQTPYVTLPECQSKCMESNSCLYGLDWDPSNAQNVRCWFSTSASLGSATGVTHYYQSCAGSLTTDSIYTLPPPSTTYGPTSSCQWFVLNDTNTRDGMLVPEANTIDSCKTKCQASPTCIRGYGFDFNPNNLDGKKCYLTVNRQLYNTPGIQHYEPSAVCIPSKSSSAKADLVILILFFFINKLLLIDTSVDNF